MCELSSMIITLRVSLVASCQNPDINWYCIEDIVNLQCTFICLLIHNNNVLKCPQREFISRDKCVPTLYINQPTHCWPLYISKQPFCQFLISVDWQPPVLIFFFFLNQLALFFSSPFDYHKFLSKFKESAVSAIPAAGFGDILKALQEQKVRWWWRWDEEIWF